MKWQFKKIVETYMPHLAFMFLLVLSVLFYKERVFFIDSAFQFFELINYPEITVPHGRYSTYFTKLPTFYLAKITDNVKFLSVFFSSWFIVFYYAVFLIINYVLKHKEAGLILVFSLVLCVYDGFYHTVAEIHLGVVFVCLLMAVQETTIKVNNWLRGFLIFILVVLSLFSHPVTLFLVAYLFAKGFLIQNKKAKINLIVVYGLAMCIYAIYKITVKTSYEQGLYNNLYEIVNLTKNFTNLYSYNFFFEKYWGRLYQIQVIILVSSAFFNLIKKKYLNLLVHFSAIFFLYINIITYSNGDSDIMMEKSFFPLSFFLGVMLIQFSKAIKSRVAEYTVWSVMLFLVIFSFRTVLSGKNKHINRVNYLSYIIDDMKNFEEKKFIINHKNINSDIIKISWAVPFETALINAVQNTDKSRSLYVSNNIFEEKINLEDTLLFLGASFNRDIPVSIINKDKFDFTNSKFRILEKPY